MAAPNREAPSGSVGAASSPPKSSGNLAARPHLGAHIPGWRPRLAAVLTGPPLHREGQLQGIAVLFSLLESIGSNAILLHQLRCTCFIGDLKWALEFDAAPHVPTHVGEQIGLRR
ncbi:hypothetical protein KSP40_PGU010910 [Platanthera guangdongensis]|uniref:Uncharacterized protein n=1 Tax=Platanthera guangdongensis TaxID=2320717 RepID=A0ABR2MRS4_9ASPA